MFKNDSAYKLLRYIKAKQASASVGVCRTCSCTGVSVLLGRVSSSAARVVALCLLFRLGLLLGKRWIVPEILGGGSALLSPAGRRVSTRL